MARRPACRSWARSGLLTLAICTLTPGTAMPSAPTEPDTDRKPNALAGETSPYLLQHAYNPVDWKPWGQAAFDEARKRNVPIFLSVGYSTCYWCHVMERESFEDEAIAALMNEKFVCIKVDREERPDVDDIYMASVQALTRRGGWPMSVWMTPPGARGEDDPGLEPFFGGTYFPAEPRAGMSSFPQLLDGVSQAWAENRDAVLQQATQVTGAVRQMVVDRAEPVVVGPEQVEQAASYLMRIYDSEHAGFGQAPKFPQPVFADFLLDALPTLTDPAVQRSVSRALRHTLDRMAMGGMYDQVGGGFHRYSTDGQWLVPHFEKMLYDNGQLASLYAKSFMRDPSAGGGDPFEAEIIRETLEYVLREMTDDKGAFHSAQDAEVNHREGQNYLWTRAQLDEVLSEEDAAFIAQVYGVDRGTNFQDPHHPEDAPTNVLFLPERPERLSVRLGEDLDAFKTRVSAINLTLYEARMQRDQPGLDDKVITAWNGLMIAGLADGARALGEAKYIEAGRRAAAFIMSEMRDETGLLRIYRNGQAKTPAFLIDYAALVKGLLALHQAAQALGTPASDELEQARTLIDEAFERFEDPSHPGVLYDTLPEQSDLIVRAFSTYDGAMPSGQSVMLNSLITLHEIAGDEPALERAIRLLAALSSSIKESPPSPINATRGLHRLLQVDAAALRGHLGASAEQDEDDEVVRLDDSPVKVFASAERVIIKPGEQVTLEVELRIDEGYHITANDPGVEGLIPLRVEVAGGSGVGVETTYPEPVIYNGAALPEEFKGQMKVHEGTVRLTLTLTRTDVAWDGRPMILVTYQACDDSACFQPITVELDVALDEG